MFNFSRKDTEFFDLFLENAKFFHLGAVLLDDVIKDPNKSLERIEDILGLESAADEINEKIINTPAADRGLRAMTAFPLTSCGSTLATQDQRPTSSPPWWELPAMTARTVWVLTPLQRPAPQTMWTPTPSRMSSITCP